MYGLYVQTTSVKNAPVHMAHTYGPYVWVHFSTPVCTGHKDGPYVRAVCMGSAHRPLHRERMRPVNAFLLDSW